MTNKTYDILKYVALLIMPALATFVNGVGIVWGPSYERGDGNDHRIRRVPGRGTGHLVQELRTRDTRQPRGDEA